MFNGALEGLECFVCFSAHLSTRGWNHTVGLGQTVKPEPWKICFSIQCPTDASLGSERSGVNRCHLALQNYRERTINFHLHKPTYIKKQQQQKKTQGIKNGEHWIETMSTPIPY